jgi:hypothetical protein
MYRYLNFKPVPVLIHQTLRIREILAQFSLIKKPVPDPDPTYRYLSDDNLNLYYTDAKHYNEPIWKKNNILRHIMENFLKTSLDL